MMGVGIVANYPEGGMWYQMSVKKDLVFFPLPEGQQYADYLDGVKAKLPDGVLQSFVIGNRTVLAGPVSAIPILFSSTAGN